MRLDAVYIVVRDIPRARAFYERVFDCEPVLVDARFSGFDLDGGLFGLFAAQFFHEAVDTRRLSYGNNCVANIRVTDIEEEWDRIAALEPPHVTDLQQTDNYRLFQIEDEDGNRVEFYQEHLGSA